MQQINFWYAAALASITSAGWRAGGENNICPGKDDLCYECHKGWQTMTTVPMASSALPSQGMILCLQTPKFKVGSGQEECVGMV